MPKTKIQDESEVVRWFQEGRTLAWMQQEYESKYNITTSMGMWSEFRLRKGLDRRITRDVNLIPWAVRREHRWGYPIAMLRLVARDREGKELTPLARARMDSFLANLEAKGLVVDYDPDSLMGWKLIKRGSQDEDWIRRPSVTRQGRKNQDLA